MEQKNYRWYFNLVIIYATFNILMSFVLLIPYIGELLVLLTLPISIGWWIFSIVMLVLFLKDEMPRFYLFFPIYYLAAFFLSSAFSFIIGFVFGDDYIGIFFISCMALATSIAEIAIAFYLLKNKIENGNKNESTENAVDKAKKEEKLQQKEN